jgi:hypothetical protein
MVWVAAFGSEAKAVPVNPAEWQKIILATDGEDVFWNSTTHVDTDYLQYDYEWQWELTRARLRLDILNDGWIDVLTYVPAADKGGSGTDDELPFVILDQDVGEPGVFTAHVTAGVDINGYGYVSMTDITLGSFSLSDVVYDVTGAWFEVDATVTTVPEPATLSLLALGSLLLLRKRRL